MMQTTYMRTYACAHVGDVSIAEAEASARWGKSSADTLQPARAREIPSISQARVFPRWIPQEIIDLIVEQIPADDLLVGASRASRSKTPSNQLFARALFGEGIRRLEAVQARCAVAPGLNEPLPCATLAINHANACLMASRSKQLGMSANAYGTVGYGANVVNERDSKDALAAQALGHLARHRPGIGSFFALSAVARSLATLGEDEAARQAANALLALARTPKLAPFSTDVLTEWLIEEGGLRRDTYFVASEVSMLIDDASMFQWLCGKAKQEDCNLADAMVDWWDHKVRRRDKQSPLRRVFKQTSGRLDCR